MASRAFPREPSSSSSPSCSRAEATAPPPPSSSSPLFASVQMGSRSPPSPMIGRAGNLTVFITPPSPASTPRSSRPSDSSSPDLSTPASRPSPPPPTSVSPPNKASPPAPPVRFSPPAPPVKVSAPPVTAPPPQYGKASAGGKHDDGSAFGFLWDAVARVQEAHASLDEYVANWFGLDQSKYQWALNDYYETTGKEVEPIKAGKPKELTTTTKVQKV